MDVFRSTAAQLLVSDRRLQLALLLQPAATGAVAEMGEVVGGVEAEEWTDWWVSLWWSAAVEKDGAAAAAAAAGGRMEESRSGVG